MTPEATDLHSIVNRLERQNRWMKNLGVAALVLITAGMVMGQTLPKEQTVEARKFVVRDKDGKIRVEMGVQDDNSSTLVIKGPGGMGSIDLTVLSNSMASLDLSDSDGKILAQLQLLGHFPRLVLTAKDEKARAQFLLLDSGISALSLYGGKDGKAGVWLGAQGKDGSASLAINDQQGKTRARLGVDQESSPSLDLADENGQTRATLGTTSLTTTKTGSIEKRAPSSLVLFDKEGKLLWSAP